MPITLDCPRCKQPLVVPTKKAGSYVNCPRCNGRFWVPDSAKETGKASRGAPGMPEEDLTSSVIVPLGKPPLATPPGVAHNGGSSAGVTPEVPTAAPPIASPPPPPPAPPPGGAPTGSKVSLNPAGGMTKFDWTPPSAARPSGPQPPPPATVPPAKKVARFVAAEAPAAGLKLAEDGKLPELQLQEGIEDQSQKKHSGMNPLALAGLLCLSVASSIALVVFNPNQQGAVNTEQHRRAWREIEANYFSNMDPNAPLSPYQVYLREARQAATRGDARIAADRLRRVLALLRTERGGLEEKQRRFEGTQWGLERTLTGSPDRDVKLEEYITILLRQEQ